MPPLRFTRLYEIDKNPDATDNLDTQADCIYNPPVITYDEIKRRSNLVKHGIDLADLESAFDFPMVTDEDDRRPYGEQRLRSLAQHNGRVVVLIWVVREPAAHLISCRFADKHETQRYIESI